MAPDAFDGLPIWNIDAVVCGINLKIGYVALLSKLNSNFSTPRSNKISEFILAEESNPTRESFADPVTYKENEPCGAVPTPSCDPLN